MDVALLLFVATIACSALAYFGVRLSRKRWLSAVLALPLVALGMVLAASALLMVSMAIYGSVDNGATEITSFYFWAYIVLQLAPLALAALILGKGKWPQKETNS